jgi:hypothetical protein
MCIICLSEENLDIVTLCCYNTLHKSCLNNWLNTNNTCPICRNEHIKELLQNISDQQILNEALPRTRPRTMIKIKIIETIETITIYKR